MRQSAGLRRRSSWWHLMILVVTLPAFKPCSGNTRGWKEIWRPWRTRFDSAYPQTIFFYPSIQTCPSHLYIYYFIVLCTFHLLQRCTRECVSTWVIQYVWYRNSVLSSGKHSWWRGRPSAADPPPKCLSDPPEKRWTNYKLGTDPYPGSWTTCSAQWLLQVG